MIIDDKSNVHKSKDADVSAIKIGMPVGYQGWIYTLRLLTTQTQLLIPNVVDSNHKYEYCTTIPIGQDGFNRNPHHYASMDPKWGEPSPF